MWQILSRVTKGNDVPTYQDVVGLDVPVDEAHLVDTVHGAHQLADVEPEEGSVSGQHSFGGKDGVMERGGRGLLGEVLLEDAKLDEEGHEVAARDVVHHEVKIVPVLVTQQKPG